MPIGLAPTARSAFKAHDIDNAALDGAPLFDLPFNPGVQVRGYSAINQPNCQVIIEDFMPGSNFVWTFAHDEFQYTLSGAIEIEVFMPPLYSESVKTRLSTGSVYTFPVGARMHVSVVSAEPYRHICFCPPSPDYPFPTWEALSGAD